MSEFDPFKLKTGYASELTAVQFKNVRFAPKSTYMDGEWDVMLVDLHTGDSELGENGVLEDMIPLGEKGAWEAKDDGDRVEHESGREQMFGEQSGIGILLASGLEFDGFEEEVKKRWGEDGQSPMHAAMWEGLIVDLEKKASGKGEYATTRWNIVGYHANGDSGKTEEKAEKTEEKTSRRGRKPSAATVEKNALQVATDMGDIEDDDATFDKWASKCEADVNGFGDMSDDDVEKIWKKALA